MICLRCGGCCLHLDIFVINPDHIREDGSIDRLDPCSMIFKPSGLKCPHLFFQSCPGEAEEEETAVCKIHHLPCYRDSPCQQFEQMGLEDDVCIMSAYFKNLGCREKEKKRDLKKI